MIPSSAAERPPVLEQRFLVASSTVSAPWPAEKEMRERIRGKEGVTRRR
jgi:hypothetical protein